jgi:hypothetical protein
MHSVVAHHTDFLIAAAGSLIVIQVVLYLSLPIKRYLHIEMGDAMMQLVAALSANVILVLLGSWSIRQAIVATLLSDVFMACRFLLELLRDRCMLSNAADARRRR